MNDHKTPFVPGNQLWKLRDPEKAGRPVKIKTKDEIWGKAVEYFEWCESNPIKEGKMVQVKGDTVLKAIPKMRAMTLDGLTIYLNISMQGWYEYKKKPDFSEVCSDIERIIKEQKFTGAAAGVLNPNIIARDLGLSDKKEHTGNIGLTDMSEDQLDAKLKSLMDAISNPD